MRALIVPVLAALLAGCATAPVSSDLRPLLADGLFAAPEKPVDPDQVFALSPAMRDYLRGELQERARQHGPREALLEALRRDIRIEYDVEMTRNAAEAFAARSGNCLSLVIMTAALARELDIPLQFQTVFGHETWTRGEGLNVRSGHVNLVLGSQPPEGWTRLGSDSVVVDFIPPDRAAQFTARPIAESDVLAMYLNNRAAETLSAGDNTAAYWWVREALNTAPRLTAAYNTLGVIYRRAQHLELAERAWRHALEQEPQNANVLSNLAQLLANQGRDAEAGELRKRLTMLSAHPPFYFLDQGLAALARQENRAAIRWFERELERIPQNEELHFALAIAHLRLGKSAPAQLHLGKAHSFSTTLKRRALYAAKLDHLKATAHP